MRDLSSRSPDLAGTCVAMGQARFDNCSFVSNRVDGGAVGGGAVRVSTDAVARFNDTAFVDNRALAAVRLPFSSDAVVQHCPQACVARGGAVWAVLGGVVHFSASVFVDNAVAGCGASGGGAVAAPLPASTFHQCAFESNVAAVVAGSGVGSGGGGAMLGSATAALDDETQDGAVTFSNCQFRSNRAERWTHGDGDVGEEAEEEAGQATTAGHGGAVVLESGAVASAAGCVFAANAAHGDGGAVRLESTSRAAFARTFFQENSAAGYGGAVRVDTMPSADSSSTSGALVLVAGRRLAFWWARSVAERESESRSTRADTVE